MNRLVLVALLVTGLLVGFLSRPPVVEAQPPRFPFSTGDSISITYQDSTSRSCVIENFFGSFVSCKVPEQPFGQPPLPRVYNLSTSVSVTLVSRPNER